MADCELIAKCGFFKKYGTSFEAACKGLIKQYCQGPRQSQCKRKEYRMQHGSPPPDDMLPAGHKFKG